MSHLCFFGHNMPISIKNDIIYFLYSKIYQLQLIHIFNSRRLFCLILFRIVYEYFSKVLFVPRNWAFLNRIDKTVQNRLNYSLLYSFSKIGKKSYKPGSSNLYHLKTNYK
ncbi:hypothetical protein BpHYR1_031631 [Brachionus plicatilis]|uniref:Uncharacterized protein n=1 Tax=Brachionus plicatilis TaxID=10195 RepID=A0A3M7S512_BRAPC|nr:hypothetical protein BpHYR1_031631 [Brachionus plicatilis]